MPVLFWMGTFLYEGGDKMPDGREQDYVSRKEFNIDRDNKDAKFAELDRRITTMEVYWQNWNKLPDTIQEISTTMALMQQEITSLSDSMKGMGEKMEKFAEEKEKQDKAQNTKLNEIDNKSKVDILEWLKLNWVQILIGLGMLSLIVKELTTLITIK